MLFASSDQRNFCNCAVNDKRLSERPLRGACKHVDYYLYGRKQGDFWGNFTPNNSHGTDTYQVIGSMAD